MIKVQGYCPMGCGQTLFLADSGNITCNYRSDTDGCPQPDAASMLLEDRETEHIVELREDGFTIRHPLRERLNDDLLSCDLHTYISYLPPAGRRPGRYRARYNPAGVGTWQFETP